MLSAFTEFAKELPGLVAAIGVAVLAAVVLAKRLTTLPLGVSGSRTPEDDSGDVQGADVNVEYRRGTTEPHDWIVARNDGPSVAEDVTLEVLGDHSRSSTPVVKSDWEQTLPAQLQPDQECTLEVAPRLQAPPPYELKVTWEDTHGREEKTTEVRR